MKLDEIAGDLSAAGLNLMAVIGTHSMGECLGLEHWDSLILIGNAGPKMWQQIPEEYFNRADPVDDFARDTVRQAMTRSAGSLRWQIVFPDSNYGGPSLQKLGKLAGWHNESPLGIGVNADWGLWYAYRAVVLVSAELQSTPVNYADSPCLECETRACVKSCPGSALTFGKPPDLHRCVRYRLQPDSKCEENCVARSCCPVAPELRYTQSQIAYHYRLALPALSDWLIYDSANPLNKD